MGVHRLAMHGGVLQGCIKNYKQQKHTCNSNILSVSSSFRYSASSNCITDNATVEALMSCERENDLST